MSNQLLPTRVVVNENKQEWFWLLMSYMQMKTYALWLSNYPDTSYESFLLIWPTLLDQMLLGATRAAVKALGEKVPVNLN